MLADWVARYLRDLPRGQRPSEPGYDDWVAEHPGAPWSSVLVRAGGWSKTLAVARKRRRRSGR